jgi:hypothetical protein
MVRDARFRGLLAMRVWHLAAKQDLILRSARSGRLEGRPQAFLQSGFPALHWSV